MLILSSFTVFTEDLISNNIGDFIIFFFYIYFSIDNLFSLMELKA